MTKRETDCDEDRHDWQVTSIPVQTVSALGQPGVIVQFFRSCPWCKVNEDIGGRSMTMNQKTAPILS